MAAPFIGAGETGPQAACAAIITLVLVMILPIACINVLARATEIQQRTKALPPEHHIAVGPVPSRRLDQSLGINNATTKARSYTCIYCQVGPTTEKGIEPKAFFSPTRIHAAVAVRVEGALKSTDHDGEPLYLRPVRCSRH